MCKHAFCENTMLLLIANQLTDNNILIDAVCCLVCHCTCKQNLSHVALLIGIQVKP